MSEEEVAGAVEWILKHELAPPDMPESEAYDIVGLEARHDLGASHCETLNALDGGEEVDGTHSISEYWHGQLIETKTDEALEKIWGNPEGSRGLVSSVYDIEVACPERSEEFIDWATDILDDGWEVLAASDDAQWLMDRPTWPDDLTLADAESMVAFWDGSANTVTTTCALVPDTGSESTKQEAFELVLGYAADSSENGDTFLIGATLAVRDECPEHLDTYESWLQDRS